MDGLLENKTAVITGGSSGIGREIALTFATHGANTVLADIRDSPRDADTPTHEMINSETDTVSKYVSCDVRNVSEIYDAVSECEEFGGIDIMVNNAGITRPESFLDVTEEEYDQIMQINAKGTFFGMQAAATAMLEGEKSDGTIINISSIAGLEGAGDYVTYSTSKAAVKLMTYAAADFLGPEQIRVNCVHPGPTKTALSKNDVSLVGTEAGEKFLQNIPLGRFADPSEIANPVLFLASDLASFVNGSSLIVDGGAYNTRGRIVE